MDIKELFESLELSESAKEKVAQLPALFESAITERTEEIKTQLQEEFDLKVEARLAELDTKAELYIAEEVLPNIDKVLNYAVTEWANKNQVAIESGAKVALAESFLTGMVALAESHNVTLPQVDVATKLQSQIDSLQESLNAVTEKNVELSASNIELTKKSIVQECTSTLSELQSAKISESLKNIQFSSVDQYKTAVKELVESTHPVTSAPANVEPTVEPIVENKPEMSPYMQRLFESLKSK